MAQETAARLFFNWRVNYASEQCGERLGRIFQQALHNHLTNVYGSWQGSLLWLSVNFQDVMDVLSKAEQGVSKAEKGVSTSVLSEVEEGRVKDSE